MNRLIKQRETILDVGCAFRDFLESARKLGWRKVYGLEVSQYAYKIGRKMA